MDRKKVVRGVSILLFGAMVAGCAPTALPAPAPTMAPVPAAATSAPAAPVAEVFAGGTVTGAITFAGEPLAGARAELRTTDWRTNPNAVAAEAVTGADGRYSVQDVPQGEFVVVGVFPDGTDDAAAYRPVTITPGTVITGADITLERPLAPVAPAPDAEVALMPTLEWEGMEEASEYHVLVVDAGTTEPVADQTVVSTTLAITTPLEAGRTYNWTVTAYTADQISVGVVDGQFTTAAGPATATATPAAASELDRVPPSCHPAEGLTTLYHDGDYHYCFLYPVRFKEITENPETVNIVGPALDQSIEPVFASLSIESAEVAAGMDLEGAVDEFLKEFADLPFAIERQELLLGGVPAEVLEPVPGRLAARVVVAIQGNTVYKLWFHPAPEQVEQVDTDVEELFQTVTGSFTFLQ